MKGEKGKGKGKRGEGKGRKREVASWHDGFAGWTSLSKQTMSNSGTDGVICVKYIGTKITLLKTRQMDPALLDSGQCD